MLNILPGDRVAELDRAYVLSNNLATWELMERAAVRFSQWFCGRFTDKERPILIFCGPGNNGGDGLAVARLLSITFSRLKIVHLEAPEKCSGDFRVNWDRLPPGLARQHWDQWEFAQEPGLIVIDGIFGVGINRGVEGRYLEAIQQVNRLIGTKVAIDIPSGIPADHCIEGDAIKADITFTFQFPKLSLLFPEHAEFVGEMVVEDIGIPEDLLERFSANKYFIQTADILTLHRIFHKFSHKGDFGRILLIGGSEGKAGAMVLAARAALRTGSGLAYVSVGDSERPILQVTVPEAVVASESDLSDFPRFDSIGFGPGWGLEVDPSYFESILATYRRPVVIDADGLNLLAKYPGLLDAVPPGSILTPHLREFERLFGHINCHADRLIFARDLAIKHQVFLVLKGAYTAVSCPDGFQYFNSTGNKFMATAGSGDVLTGMLTSLLGQGYAPKNAVLCGVFHHGLAGDLAAKQKNRGLIASDIVESIPRTFLELEIP